MSALDRPPDQKSAAVRTTAQQERDEHGAADRNENRRSRNAAVDGESDRRMSGMQRTARTRFGLRLLPRLRIFEV